jgi:hypothetical protein
LEFSIAAGVGRNLQLLSAGHREADIHLGRPRKITSFTQFHMPCSWRGDGWSNHLEAPGVSYSDRLRIDGRSVIESRELTIDAWSTPAGELEAYNEIARKLQGDSLVIWARERFGRIRPWTGMKGFNVWYGILIAWLILIVLRVVFAQR